MTATTNNLTRYLSDLIQQEGPISIATYMELALGHPEYGYYMTRDPLGLAGDFTTSPEISQMFGELLGLWCVDMWSKLGCPSPFLLVELGPGRGTLMADALRAAALVPEFGQAAQVSFVEMSPVLRAEQKKNVSTARWYDTIEELPDTPLLVIANEFFDALPIHQFQRTELGWCEKRVGLGPSEENTTPTLQFGLAKGIINPDMLPITVRNAPLGSIAETCPLGANIMHKLAGRVDRNTGAALIIDYGHPQSAAGDTLQAMKHHKYVDVLQTPGEADITAHVDFEKLKDVAQNNAVYGPVEQGSFLKALGIESRVQKLKTRASIAQAHEIETALTRLTAPDAMGKLFKVMALTSSNVPAPAGF
jgi:NADH dehydrogenase [ubiquinone] 1 alpha subcomplex assembly factor 7